MKHLLLSLLASGMFHIAFCQDKTIIITDTSHSTVVEVPRKKVLNGVASYYADKFVGKRTANGEFYSHNKLTAACNKLPLGTWIRVTNLRNQKSVVVKINDRMHPKNTRIVDLSRVAAERLGFIKRGLTQVKVEVLGKIKPKT